MSALQVFDEYMAHVGKYSDLIERLPTRAFLAPLEEDEEVELGISRGVGATIRFKAVGELQDSGGWCVCVCVRGGGCSSLRAVAFVRRCGWEGG